MTNVPNEIRELWKEVYCLFDLNYNMPNTAESWKKFWDQAEVIRQKYDPYQVGALLLVVSDMIEYHITDKKLHPHTLEDMNLF